MFGMKIKGYHRTFVLVFLGIIKEIYGLIPHRIRALDPYNRIKGVKQDPIKKSVSDLGLWFVRESLA